MIRWRERAVLNWLPEHSTPIAKLPTPKTRTLLAQAPDPRKADLIWFPLFATGYTLSVIMSFSGRGLNC